MPSENRRLKKKFKRSLRKDDDYIEEILNHMSQVEAR